MDQEIQEHSTNQNQRVILGNISNTLGKRPLSFDIDKPSKSNKLAPNQQIPTETLKPKNQDFQDLFNRKEKSNNSSNTRHTGNYFAKENGGGTNRSWYFKHLMHEPGAQGGEEREASPESEDNFEEEYETDNEENGKSNTGVSSNFFSVRNSGSSKLDSFAGLDKTCNCSFCIKATYMWMDLHYQDTRGRLSALKRSKRLARSLGEKLYGPEYKNKVTGESSNEGAKMEFELMQQWRSLFMHTENLFVRETSQLHSTLMNLEELRENCKSDLHTISGVSSSQK